MIRDSLLSMRRTFAAWLREEFPALTYGGYHTYRVHSAGANGRIDLDPVEPGMIAIPAIDQWPGLAGGKGIPAAGSLAIVAFRDSRPERPMIVAFQPSRLDGGVPPTTVLDATTKVQIGPSAATVELAGGAQFVALENLVATQFGTLKSAINGAGVLAGDGGATFKTALLAALASWPGSVAASKVKAT